MASIEIPALRFLLIKDAMDGLEPPYQVLQTYAYPLGHMAMLNFQHVDK